MLMIRVEVIEELTGTPDQHVKALVLSDRGHGLDGDDRNVITVWDAYGKFRAKGQPGQCGPLAYVLWMPDKNRFEILSVT